MVVQMPMTFDFDSMKDILVCPDSKSALVPDGESLICCDPECRKQYPICDGIPIMLVEEAMELSAEQWAEKMHAAGRDVQTGAPADSPSADRDD